MPSSHEHGYSAPDISGTKSRCSHRLCSLLSEKEGRTVKVNVVHVSLLNVSEIYWSFSQMWKYLLSLPVVWNGVEQFFNISSNVLHVSTFFEICFEGDLEEQKSYFTHNLWDRDYLNLNCLCLTVEHIRTSVRCISVLRITFKAEASILSSAEIISV